MISSDTKLAIFKSFEVLLAECLLYLQDRLSELEENIWVLNETESNMKGMDDAYFSIERQEIMLEVADLSKKYCEFPLLCQTPDFFPYHCSSSPVSYSFLKLFSLLLLISVDCFANSLPQIKR